MNINEMLSKAKWITLLGFQLNIVFLCNLGIQGYRTRSNFRGPKLSRISQIHGFRVFIFAGPHPVPLFFLFKLTSDRPE